MGSHFYCCVIWWVQAWVLYIDFLQIDENLEQWPHLNELVQCYRADWVKDENKYGHYESVSPPSFQNQIFEGPDTDIETGFCFDFSCLIHFLSALICSMFVKWLLTCLFMQRHDLLMQGEARAKMPQMMTHQVPLEGNTQMLLMFQRLCFCSLGFTNVAFQDMFLLDITILTFMFGN